MRLITAQSKPRLDAWWDEALNTTHVARFMGVDGWERTSAELGDGWNKVHYLSDDGSTLLSVGLDRSARTDARLAIWCLHQDRQRRAVQVGQMLHRLPGVLRELHVHVAKSIVHGSNAESLRLHRKRLGAPWGVQPNAAWDPMFGRYVDLFHFQAPVAYWMPRQAP